MGVENFSAKHKLFAETCEHYKMLFFFGAVFNVIKPINWGTTIKGLLHDKSHRLSNIRFTFYKLLYKVYVPLYIYKVMILLKKLELTWVKEYGHS